MTGFKTFSVLLYIRVYGRIKNFYVMFHGICGTKQTNVRKRVLVHKLSTNLSTKLPFYSISEGKIPVDMNIAYARARIAHM